MKRNQLQQLEAIDGMVDKAEDIKCLKKEINEVLLREEIMWKQRSRALWLKWGDRNTKFFHATASQRRRKNRIEGLQNQNGEWIDDQQGIENISLEYFVSIFKSDFPSNFAESLEAISPRVTSDMNKELLAEFKAAEVWKALKQMHPTKAPGPDGMSPLFFHQYWDVVGSDVISCVLDVLNSGVLPCELIETYICLIPKVASPISLCNVVYKTISKVLANRLKKILREVIDEAQSTFVPGRSITDNVLVAFETMHYIDQRRKV